MTEVWRDIKGHEGSYQVSDLGRVRSLDRLSTTKAGIVKKIKGRILSPCNNGKGYMYVSLGRGDREYIHRLVARAFVSNPSSLNEINHLNEIKSDNRAHNLEWVTRLENIRHGTGIKRGAIARTPLLLNGKCSKPIIAMRISDNASICFPSIAEATRHGFDAGMIIKCCKGVKETYRGYKFNYV